MPGHVVHKNEGHIDKRQNVRIANLLENDLNYSIVKALGIFERLC